jgi:DNA repair protein RecO (recombination protein O)
MTTRRRSSAVSGAAYVLHRYDWSESSLILDLFTRDHGRLAAVAKGAKRPYSQLRAVLLPFQRVQVALSQPAGADGANEVHTLRSAEYAGDAAILGGAALFAGFYLNELLMKLLARQDPHPRLFDAYAATLRALAERGEGGAQPSLRAFELVLLRETGVLPDLALTTLRQQPLALDAPYALRAETGLEPCADDALAVPGAVWRDAAATLAQDDLPALVAACARAAAPLKAQLRALLHYHLGIPMLRTRQVMLDLQRLADTAQGLAR